MRGKGLRIVGERPITGESMMLCSQIRINCKFIGNVVFLLHYIIPNLL